MLVNFTIQNFGCIKEKQTFSLEATRTDDLEEYYIVEPIPKLRLLKLGLIYGANASGKTTILQALEFLRHITTKPLPQKTDEFNFEPFLFDENTPKENTVFSIEFVQNKKRYFYQVELNKNAIISETLNWYNPNKANLYKRNTDIKNQLTKIKFGNKIKIRKNVEQTLESNTLWNNTVLGAFLKINANFPELKVVSEWFVNYLSEIIEPKPNLQHSITHLIEEQKINKNQVIEILKEADFNITDILIKEDKQDLSEELSSFFTIDVIDYLKKSKIFPLSLFDLRFEHNKKYTLDYYQESQGTQRYYALSGLLALLIHQSLILSIDELESSLHPDLFIHFLLTFIVNSNNSQLIVTTHNREILNDKNIFRNDAIWFTEKNESNATEIYSLADFDTTTVRNTNNVLNIYKTGKLGAIPKLGSYDINTLKHEKTKT